MADTPLRRIRVGEPLWQDFGEATRAMGTDRTKALVAFMKRYVAATSPTQTTDTDQGIDSSR